MSGPTPWREVRRALDGPRVAAELGLKAARERSKFGCVACDSTDALHVYKDGAKCFSCGWSGSVIDLAALHWRVEPREACRRLAERFGVQPDPMRRGGGMLAELERGEPGRPEKGANGGAISSPYRSAIAEAGLVARLEVLGDMIARTTLGSSGRDYLAGRGLSPDLADAHGVRSMGGPDDWRATWADLTRLHGIEGMEAAGLARDGRAWIPWGGKVPAIVLPYLDLGGHVVAVRWRRSDDVRENRFRTPLGGATPIPWHAEAVDAPRPLRLVVAEGELDGLALCQAGYDAIGLGGATPSTAVLTWLVEALEDVEHLALWTDADAAGDGAVDRLAAQLAERYGASWVRARVSRWRAAADPADTLKGAVA